VGKREWMLIPGHPKASLPAHRSDDVPSRRLVSASSPPRILAPIDLPLGFTGRIGR
jgi:hypothetical protein